MGRTLVTPPAEEPLGLQEAKDHLRETASVTQQDDVIAADILAAREHAEAVLGKHLITQTWTETFDAFPCVSLKNRFAALRLSLAPIQSVTELRYTDTSGVDTLLATSVYTLRKDRHPPEIALKYGQTWPATRDEPDAVRVTVVVGYGDSPDAVPSEIRTWMKQYVENAFLNRGGSVQVPDDLLLRHAVLAVA